MARKISKETWDNWGKLPEKVDKEAVKAERENQFITQIRKYKLITPLFGGGADPKKADAVKIIRETEIRGQLRFWWRAIRGVGTIPEMSDREAEIFGTSASEKEGNKLGQSKVKVSVNVDKDKEGDKIYKDSFDVPKYAVFPLENNDVLRKDVEFTLEISFPSKNKNDIEATLWAWETFGGIGGRTRRGFGAIQLLAIDTEEVNPPKCNEVKSYIATNLGIHLAQGNWDINVPHLSNHTDNFAYSNPSMMGNTENSIIVWKNIVDKLHRFRQSPRNATTYNGESHWSEPDAIRRITGRHATVNSRDSNSKDRTPTHSVGNKFPRGQLGLPIIFKFKNQDEKNGDPQTQTLQGKDFERLSSPLILRPIACSDGAVGIGLALETPREPFGGVILKGHRGTVQTKLDVADIANVRPIYNASKTEIDVVKAFLKTI
jgi:CRISPR-associated protein Cmr1